MIVNYPPLRLIWISELAEKRTDILTHRLTEEKFDPHVPRAQEKQLRIV